MNPAMPLALKKALETALANLPLDRQGGRGKRDGEGPARVFIGDMPPKKGEVYDLPCVLVIPAQGWEETGEACATVGLVCCVYNAEEGDREGAEMDVALLINAVTRALMPFRQTPLEKKFRLVPDAEGRYLRWNKNDMQPRPYVQASILSHWRMKGVE